MVNFSYCFCLTLIHSLWQSALLVFMYICLNSFTRKNNPAAKRNILYGMLFAQVLLSISTFFIYYLGSFSFYIDDIVAAFPGIDTGKPILQKAAPWLIGAYMLILLYRSSRLIFNWMKFKTSIKASWTRPSVNLRLFTTLKSYEFGIRRKVTLWYSSSINTPLTFGFFKPVILLPVALLNNLSVEETETLIIHELTHIKNNDYFLNWLLVACETIFFFNPFIHILGNKVRLEREKNCDTQVLQFNYPAISYAETLLKAASLKTTPAPFFLAAVLKNSQLLTRIKFFTKENNLQFYKRNYPGLTITLTAMLVTLNLFLVNNFRQENNRSPVVSTVNTSSPVNLLNDEFISQFSTVVTPLIEKVSKIAEEASNKVLKEHIPAITTHEPAVLASNEIHEPVIESENIAIPASMTEIDDSREVTLKEESSATGKSVTKVYKMKLVNGEWKATLLWTITEKRLANDSCLVIKDSTHYYNPVQ